MGYRRLQASKKSPYTVTRLAWTLDYYAFAAVGSRPTFDELLPACYIFLSITDI
jgi:hypothetical protein